MAGNLRRRLAEPLGCPGTVADNSLVVERAVSGGREQPRHTERCSACKTALASSPTVGVSGSSVQFDQPSPMLAEALGFASCSISASGSPAHGHWRIVSRSSLVSPRLSHPYRDGVREAIAVPCVPPAARTHRPGSNVTDAIMVVSPTFNLCLGLSANRPPM